MPVTVYRGMMSVWPHTGGTGQTVAGEPTAAPPRFARDCDRGMRWRVTAIIQVVEIAVEASRYICCLVMG
jgi:hypothetical protein